jgi:hypothetical protein
MHHSPSQVPWELAFRWLAIVARPSFSSLSQAYREYSFSQPPLPLKVYKSSENSWVQLHSELVSDTSVHVLKCIPLQSVAMFDRARLHAVESYHIFLHGAANSRFKHRSSFFIILKSVCRVLAHSPLNYVLYARDNDEKDGRPLSWLHFVASSYLLQGKHWETLNICLAASRIQGSKCPYDGRYSIDVAKGSPTCTSRSTFISGCVKSQQLRVEIRCPSMSGKKILIWLCY